VSHFSEDNIVVLLRRLSGLEDVVVKTCGPPSFALTDLVRTWPFWDVKIPRHVRDRPECFQVEPYPDDMRRCVNALGRANDEVRELIREIDGGALLTVTARRSGCAPEGTAQKGREVAQTPSRS
jgi:hypothetical protein